MLDWIAETIWKIVNYVPAQFVAQDSPNFVLIRAMFGLILIVLVVAAIGFAFSVSRRVRNGPTP